MEPAMREQDALHVLIQGAIPKSRKPFFLKKEVFVLVTSNMNTFKFWPMDMWVRIAY